MKLRTMETPMLAEMYAAQRHSRWRRKWSFRIWTMLFALTFASVFLQVGGIAWHISWLKWSWSATIVFGVATTIWHWWYFRISNEVARRANDVPKWLLTRACRYYYRDDYPWECAAIECHEGHLPGDCPLCGAT